MPTTRKSGKAAAGVQGDAAFFSRNTSRTDVPRRTALGAPFLEGEYARLIDKANAPIFGIDVSGRVNVWNQKASQVTGFTAEGVMGRNLVREFITQDYQESVEEVRERRTTNGRRGRAT